MFCIHNLEAKHVEEKIQQRSSFTPSADNFAINVLIVGSERWRHCIKIIYIFHIASIKRFAITVEA